MNNSTEKISDWVLPDGFKDSIVVHPAEIPARAFDDLAEYHPVDPREYSYKCAVIENPSGSSARIRLSGTWNPAFASIAGRLELEPIKDSSSGRDILEDNTIGQRSRDTPFGKTKDWFITKWQVKKNFVPNGDGNTFLDVQETVTWVTFADGGDKVETTYRWPPYAPNAIQPRVVEIGNGTVEAVSIDSGSDSQPQMVINVHVPK